MGRYLPDSNYRSAPTEFVKLWQFGNPAILGNSTTLLNYPSGCALDVLNGELYVADSANHRIVVLDSEKGRFVRAFGQYGFEQGDFNFPRFLAVAPGPQDSVRVVVADTNERVQILARDGKGIFCLGTNYKRGGSNNEFLNATGVAVYRQRIFVADGGNHRIQMFDFQTGKYHATISLTAAYNVPTPDGFGSLALAVHEASRVLYVCDQTNHSVFAVSLADDALGTVYPAFVDGSDHAFVDPVDIHVDNVHNVVYVTDASTRRVSIWHGMHSAPGDQDEDGAVAVDNNAAATLEPGKLADSSIRARPSVLPSSPFFASGDKVEAAKAVARPWDFKAPLDRRTTVDIVLDMAEESPMRGSKKRVGFMGPPGSRV